MSNFNIELTREFGIGLAISASAQRSTMDNSLWLLSAEETLNTRKICEVKLCSREADYLVPVARFSGGPYEVVSDETARARNPNGAAQSISLRVISP